jgi:hypothetical protein
LAVQEADAGVLGRFGAIGAGLRRIVEQLRRELAPAIGYVEQQRAVAMGGIGGTQDHDIGDRFDPSVGIARRQALVGADIAEAAACEGRPAVKDVEADDLGPHCQRDNTGCRHHGTDDFAHGPNSSRCQLAPEGLLPRRVRL